MVIFVIKIVINLLDFCKINIILLLCNREKISFFFVNDYLLIINLKKKLFLKLKIRKIQI